MSPHQPEAEPPVPPAPARPGDPGEPHEPEPRDARSARERGVDPWLRSLGVQADPEARHAWLEPHLWAALRARVDASAAEKRSRWTQPGMR